MKDHNDFTNAANELIKKISKYLENDAFLNADRLKSLKSDLYFIWLEGYNQGFIDSQVIYHA